MGERDAFQLLYEGHYRAVKNYLYSLTKNMAEAEDLTQEAFLRYEKKRVSFRGECSEYTMICQIGKNLWKNSLRKTKRQEPLEENMADGRQQPFEEQPADQYKDALFERKFNEKWDWRIEPDRLLITKEELSMEIQTDGGTFADSSKGAANTLDNIAAITLPDQVKEIYYAPSLTKKVTFAFRDGMLDVEQEYMESLSDEEEEISMGESEVLLPTTFFDFSTVEQDMVEINQK
jgi:RNA polymerase sigma factor (sigma-70 family)